MFWRSYSYVVVFIVAVGYTRSFLGNGIKKISFIFLLMSFDIEITNPKKFFKNIEKQNIPGRFSDFRGRRVDFVYILCRFECFPSFLCPFCLIFSTEIAIRVKNHILTLKVKNIQKRGQNGAKIG